MHRSIFLILSLFIATGALAADPTATSYSFDECLGSHRPYPSPTESIETPDSLTPIFINHVGRHGARYPSTPKATMTLASVLQRADSIGTITADGRQLKALTEEVLERSHNYWGALDSLGKAEERGIASRMFLEFPELFIGGNVAAYSSYSPRCLMSMYEFTHQLDRLNNNVDITTSAGRVNSRMLRPFDNDASFSEYIRSQVWKTPYEDYAVTQITDAPLKRVLGNGFPLSQSDVADLAMSEYDFISGLPAMGIDVDIATYFTKEEFNALWSCHNLRQYLQRSANTMSTAPADIASPLLLDIIRTTESAVSGQSAPNVILRFAHAETLLPLYAMLRLRGSYYLTNYYDTVATHFRNFSIVPMAANLRFVLFRTDSGKYYLRADLNERPIPLLPNDDRIYLPWSEARNYMIRCLPLIDQP